MLGAGDYWMAPTGVWTPAITVDAGTEILFFREYGDWGFDVAVVRPRPRCEPTSS